MRELRWQAGFRKVLVLGLLYFAAVFTFAFAMGIARVVVVAPRIGMAAATLAEIPLVLLVSWHTARGLLRKLRLSLLHRAGMGALAFGLLMASEAALAAVLSSQTIAAWAGSLFTPLGIVGLAGQVAFAAIPVWAGRRGD